MPSNLSLSARLSADAEGRLPAWLIAEQAEKAADEYLGTKFLDKPRCPRCNLVLSVTGECCE